MTLISEAQQLAQDLDLAVFPVSAQKRPIHKGWREKASRDPAEIEKLFSTPGAALIGVPAGPDNDIMAFDLDFGHDPTPEERQRLSDWLASHQDWIERNARLHQTRSGGLHVITLYPQDNQPPRLMAPKFEVIREGFFFVWPSAGSGYEVLQVPDEMEEPTAPMLTPLGGFEYGDGGSLMSADEADRTMRSDGAAGARHDALLRMTQDWASGHPELDWEGLCATFDIWFTDIYGDLIEEERLSQLLDWYVDPGGQPAGELGRAMAGVKTTPEQANNMLAAAVHAAGGAAGLGLGMNPSPKGSVLKPKLKPIEGSILAAYDPTSDLELQPWLIEGLLRRKGNMGITGMSGVGKSTVAAAWIAGMLAGDGPSVGLPDLDPLNVAWLNAEEEAADLMRHVQVAQRELNLSVEGRLMVAGEETLDRIEHGLTLVIMEGREAVINEPLVDKLAEEIRAAEIDVLMADPITEFNDGEENNRGHAKLLNRAFRMIAQRAGVAVVYWAHTGKPGSSDPPGWYRDDIYSQRGSSQNVGSLKTAATHWPMTPGGLKAKEAWEWVRRAKNGEVPNLTAVTVVKVKNHPRFWRMAYQLKPSALDEDIAVAHPVDFDEAVLTLQQAHGSDEGISMTRLAEVIVERMGIGTHKGGVVNKQMEGEAGWPQGMRADRANGKSFIALWSGGVVCTVDGRRFSARLEGSNGAAWTCVVREV